MRFFTQKSTATNVPEHCRDGGTMRFFLHVLAVPASNFLGDVLTLLDSTVGRLFVLPAEIRDAPRVSRNTVGMTLTVDPP